MFKNSGFGKRIPLTRGHFSEFEQCYGDEPNGNSPRVDLGENGRFRCFTREQINVSSTELKNGRR
ncbi:hypothetical protein [Nostoc sp.]|uniref:hypothetical protein n=1 Tax=Nostoc sp. TaxID=1180 RepID=UPI002FEFCD11